ncbi:MAG: hypothetical protein U0835_10395 [Isosphaeraceae bacterium]
MLNSVDLGVYGRDALPCPPIECRVRVIPEPILRLTSIDLNACKDVATLDELFNFGNDYLGLVKAGRIASGLVPPSLEGTATRLDDLPRRVVRPGHGPGGQQGRPHPEGLAAGRLHEPAGVTISLLMRDPSDQKPHRPARTGGGAAVVAGDLGEWIGVQRPAGLRRHLPGGEDHPRRPRG